MNCNSKYPTNTYPTSGNPLHACLTGNPSCSENGVVGQNSPRLTFPKSKNEKLMEAKTCNPVLTMVLYTGIACPVSDCSLVNVFKRFGGAFSGSDAFKVLLPYFHSSKKKAIEISQKAGLYQFNRQKFKFCRNQLIEAVCNRLLSCFRPEIFIFAH